MIVKNTYWENATPIISIITPVYNRPKELIRAMRSVEMQTYKNFEYIIVNDGSTEDLDNIVIEFMNSVSFPVMYVKKENGGVHTARNVGTNAARGVYQTGLDSDDEFFPNALECFIHAWEKIPVNDRIHYRAIVAQCADAYGKRVGQPFPNNINEFSWKEARIMCRNCRGEHITCNRSDIMKANLFLEPQGITFVSEGVLWNVLDKKYKSYFINDIVRVYHTETEISYTKLPENISKQHIINGIWNSSYVINHYNREDYTISYYIKCHIKRNCFIDLYKLKISTKPPKELSKIIKGKLIVFLTYIPAKIITKLYLNGNRNALIVHLLR